MELLRQCEAPLQGLSDPVGQRDHAEVALFAVRAALTLDPRAPLLPEDVLGDPVARFADAEPGVETGPDDERLGGRLAGVGQTIRFFGRERSSHVLMRDLSTSKSCVLGVGSRS